MNEVETAWVAGIIEGEGTINRYRYIRPDGRSYMKTILQIEMTDEDVLQKMMSITGRGSMQKKKVRNNYKQTWVWTVSNASHVKEICDKILPHMSRRRTERIVEMF